MNEDDAEFVSQHQVAARIAARAEIQDVRLLRTNVELHRQPEPDRRLTYDLNFESVIDWDSANADSFIVRIACNLNVEFVEDEVRTNAEPDTDDPDKPVATAEFEYAALFSCTMCDGDDPIGEDELSAYGATTARFLLYPFIREYIYDTTGRLALPPLTIGVLSRPLP